MLPLSEVSMCFTSQSSGLCTVSQNIFFINLSFFFLQFLHVLARKSKTTSFSPSQPPTISMLATCSVFPLCTQHGRSCSAPLNIESNWLPARKTRTCLLVGSRGMPYHFFPPAFWKRNKALVAVGLHRSSGCRCLCYLPPGDCSPTRTSPEKVQLYKQPPQSRVSTDPGRTAMGFPGVKWEVFKWWTLFVLLLLFLQNVSVPYRFPYTKCPETCSSADGWDLCYRCE